MPSAEGSSFSGRSAADEATRDPPAAPPPVGSSARLILTIALHPDIRRVGERAELLELVVAGTAELSRLAPVFRSPEGLISGPVNDLHVSRSAIVIQHDGRGAVTLRPSHAHLPCRVRGVPLAGPLDLRADELRDGVSLELARRVVLLLHVDEGSPNHHPKYGLVGESEAVRRIRARIFQVTSTEMPVLLRGESGTGKELVARAIHAASARATRPYVAVNVAALNRSTAAAEMFGYARGAFTGAARAHAGYFREADGGTLFLDEIGESPVEVQVTMLRALETGEIQPLGGSALRRVDVRLIAATDANLEQAVLHGEFRVSLLHRLAACEIWLPPLRCRRDDIPRLLVHFMRHELEAHAPSALQLLTHGDASQLLTAELLVMLLAYPWPGNVRQLGNLARQLAVGLVTEGRIAVDGVYQRLAAAAPAPAPSPAPPLPPLPLPPLVSVREDSLLAPSKIGAAALVAALRRNHWKIGATARDLGISRTSLYALIERTPGLRKARDVDGDELGDAVRRCHGDIDRIAEELGVSPRGLRLRMRELGVAEPAQPSPASRSRSSPRAC